MGQEVDLEESLHSDLKKLAKKYKLNSLATVYLDENAKVKTTAFGDNKIIKMLVRDLNIYYNGS